jgi:hypothetical protein
MTVTNFSSNYFYQIVFKRTLRLRDFTIISVHSFPVALIPISNISVVVITAFSTQCHALAGLKANWQLMTALQSLGSMRNLSSKTSCVGSRRATPTSLQKIANSHDQLSEWNANESPDPLSLHQPREQASRLWHCKVNQTRPYFAKPSSSIRLPVPP